MEGQYRGPIERCYESMSGRSETRDRVRCRTFDGFANVNGAFDILTNDVMRSLVRRRLETRNLIVLWVFRVRKYQFGTPGKAHRKDLPGS